MHFCNIRDLLEGKHWILIVVNNFGILSQAIASVWAMYCQNYFVFLKVEVMYYNYGHPHSLLNDFQY